MGAGESKPIVEDADRSTFKVAAGGGCPVGSGTAPKIPKKAADPGKCPVNFGFGQHGAASDTTELDPRNMMPTDLEHMRPGQEHLNLSKDREKSSIPKTGSENTWVYPSPQQFYNALLRKNKDPEADSMDAVVFVHNVVNEETWNTIMEREAMYKDSCPNPTLQRFVGKCDELTWAGWWSGLTTAKGKPYDRHDWYLDRCGQKTVRYIIDYYDDDSAVNQETTTSIHCRPGFDSIGDVWDRIRYPIWKRMYGNSSSSSSSAPVTETK